MLNGKCNCNKEYAGKHCDRCKNEELEYPDCNQEINEPILTTDERNKKDGERDDNLRDDAWAKDDDIESSGQPSIF